MQHDQDANQPEKNLGVAVWCSNRSVVRPGSPPKNCIQFSYEYEMYADF